MLLKDYIFLLLCWAHSQPGVNHDALGQSRAEWQLGQNLLTAGCSGARSYWGTRARARSQQCEQKKRDCRAGSGIAKWSLLAKQSRKKTPDLPLLCHGSPGSSHFLRSTSHIADSASPYPFVKSWASTFTRHTIYPCWVKLFHFSICFPLQNPQQTLKWNVHIPPPQSDNSWDVNNMEVCSCLFKICVWINKRPMPTESKRRQKQEMQWWYQRRLFIHDHFAVGATEVPLHRREVRRNAIRAHLNSASMVKDECSQLHISLDSSHTSRLSTELSMSNEHPGFFNDSYQVGEGGTWQWNLYIL